MSAAAKTMPGQTADSPAGSAVPPTSSVRGGALRVLANAETRALLAQWGGPVEQNGILTLPQCPRTPERDAALFAAGADWCWYQPGMDLAAVRLFVTDMDSTLLEVECIDEIAAAVGKKAEVAAITEAAMQGQIDFASALRQRVALLAGLPAAALEPIVEASRRYNPGAKELVAALRAQGVYSVLVSGGFTPFTARIAAELGFDEHHANVLEVDANGRLTGRVSGPIVDAAAKAKILEQVRSRLGLPRQAVLAAGDGANDCAMLQRAGIRLAYRPKPVLLSHLDVVSMRHGLDAVLRLLGR